MIAAGRKIRALDELHQAVDRDVRIVDQRKTAVDHFAQVVRRNVRRHSDGDSGRAVQQQIRHAIRQHLRHLQRFVVVRDERHGFFVEVFEHFARDTRHPHFRVAHRRRRIAIDRAEVALAVDEAIPHRKRLRHAHDRVVHGDIAVRMVFTDHVADDPRRLHVRPVVRVVEFVHRIQHASMDGLQPIANVGQCAADDDAHRVFEV